MSLLEEWLGAIGLDGFCRTHLHRSPFAPPRTATSARELLDWNVVQSMLAARADVVAVARGEIIPMPTPANARELGMYLRHGIGLRVRHAERHHPFMTRVATELETTFAGTTAHVQVCVTPAKTQGTWHADDDDVFVAQCVGKTDYLFRESEQAETNVAHLRAGDFFYLPRRWWCMTDGVEDSLAIVVVLRSHCA